MPDSSGGQRLVTGGREQLRGHQAGCERAVRGPASCGDRSGRAGGSSDGEVLNSEGAKTRRRASTSPFTAMPSAEPLRVLA